MNRLSLVFGIVVLWCASAAAEPPKEPADTVTIPLDRVWAWHTPGARDLRELEPEILTENLRGKPPEEQGRLIRASIGDRIAESLVDERFYPKKGEQAGSAFAVVGSGIDALQAARDILAHRTKRTTKFSTSDNVNLIFYSFPSETKLHLVSVERKGNSFLLQYGFSLSLEELSERTVRPNLAIIPIGRLPVGTYDVAIQLDPQNKESFMRRFKITKFDWDWMPRLICRGFTFHVEAN
jgi:hypothetical protein